MSAPVSKPVTGEERSAAGDTASPKATRRKHVPAGIRTPRARRFVARVGVPAVAVVLLGLLPLLGASVYLVVVLSGLLAYAVLAMAVNVLAGLTGLPTLAHAAYFGVGAYTTVYVAEHTTPDAVVQLLSAITAGGVVAAATGWVAVRARGTYFLMLSLAIGEILHTAARQLEDITGGSNGLITSNALSLAGNPLTLSGYVYWIVWAVFVIVGAALVITSHSPFGMALRGIRDNEPRMRSLGYPTALYKFSAYVLSGAAAGAAGFMLVAQFPRFATPEALGFQVAALALLSVVVGGLGSMRGACVGAVIVFLAGTVLSRYLGGHGPLLLGFVFVVAVYLLPRGLAGIRARSGGDGPSADDVFSLDPVKQVST